MYSGLNKGDGCVVGPVQPESTLAAIIPELDLEEVTGTSSADEAIICSAPVTLHEGETIYQTIAVGASLDASSGDIIWEQIDLEKALHRSVCMSQMTSMLRDKDRNNVYAKAIRLLIEHFKRENQHQAPVVLDIGSGTGLLALIAAESGAKHVFGVEMFDKMAEIASQVVHVNDKQDVIDIIASKSTDIDSLPLPIDLLVSELLDSALLGEACIPSHRDAISRFLSLSTSSIPLEDRICPYSGSVFVSLIESQEVLHMHDISGLDFGRSTPYRDSSAKFCRDGGGGLIPVHWEALEEEGARLLSDAHKVFEIPFNSFITESAFAESAIDVPVLHDGTLHGLLLWWRLDLLSPAVDPERGCTYSTAPKAQNWQDHWLQIVYPLSDTLQCLSGDVMQIRGKHDDLRMWFKASISVSGSFDAENKRQKLEESGDRRNEDFNVDECVAECVCGWHLLCGPERLLMMNDLQRRSIWETVTDELLRQIASLPSNGEQKLVLDVGDGSMVSIMLASKISSSLLTDVKLISTERLQFSRIHSDQLVEENKFQDVCLVVDSAETSVLLEAKDYFNSDDTTHDEACGCITTLSALICECFYFQLHAQPTWQAIRFLYTRVSFSSCISSKTIIIPSQARLMAAAFELKDFHIGHGNIGRCIVFFLLCSERR